MPNSHLVAAAQMMASRRKAKEQREAKAKAKAKERKRSVDPATKDFQKYVRNMGESIATHEGWSRYDSGMATITAKLAEAEPEHRQAILAAAVDEARRDVASAREHLERRQAALELIEAIANGGDEKALRQRRIDAEDARQGPILEKLLAAWESDGPQAADCNGVRAWFDERFPNELEIDIWKATLAATQRAAARR